MRLDQVIENALANATGRDVFVYRLEGVKMDIEIGIHDYERGVKQRVLVDVVTLVDKAWCGDDDINTIQSAARLAAARAQLRDGDATNPTPSQVLPETLVAGGGASMLRFEMLTSLVGGNLASPSLVRHTLVQAEAAPEGVLVLWAGAQQADWDRGAADDLRAAAATFAARPPES